MRTAGVILFLFLFILNAPARSSSYLPPGWHLLWSDDFNQPDGTPPDPAKWDHETGGDGWGNNELEFYTDSLSNAHVQNRQLVIEARKETVGGRNYTSARILTKGKYSWTYGRIEARMKIPRGQGVWPAFWMLGSDIDSRHWPDCGEIDIMENIGREPGAIHGTIHGPGYQNEGLGSSATLPDGKAVGDGFHTFAIECEPNSIKWFLDGRQYFSATPATLPKNGRWVFDTPKFLILNLAIGGAWPGNPDAGAVFPAKMIVDYIHVYRR